MEIFLGKVYHKRFFPRENEFSYAIHSLKFDLDEVRKHRLKWFSVNSFNLYSFHHKDHGKRDGSDLKEWAQETLKNAGIEVGDLKVTLHTFPRVLGYVFNPVSFWYCKNANDELKAIICEVNNTFGETHSYVLGAEQAQLEKFFHVSPFYPRTGQYNFDFQSPNKVIIDYWDDDKLQLRTFFGQPLITVKVILLIHWQAIRLAMKRISYFNKPKQNTPKVTF